MSAVNNHKISTRLQSCLYVITVFALVKTTHYETTPIISTLLADLLNNKNRIVTFFVLIVNPQHYLIRFLQINLIHGQIIRIVVTNIVIFMKIESVVQNHQLTPNSFHIAQTHIVLFILRVMNSNTISLHKPLFLQPPTASQLRKLPNPALPLQLQKLHNPFSKFVNHPQNNINMIALQPKRLQSNTVSSPKANNRFLQQLLRYQSLQFHQRDPLGYRNLLSAEKSLNLYYINKFRSNRVVIAVNLSHQLLIQTRKYRSIKVL